MKARGFSIVLFVDYNIFFECFLEYYIFLFFYL